MQAEPPFNKQGALSISEFCTWASIGRTLVYRLIKQKQLQPLKVGRRTLISSKEADRWLGELTQKSQIFDDGVAHDVTHTRNVNQKDLSMLTLSRLNKANSPKGSASTGVTPHVWR